jgi:hypothetical protein
LRSEERRLFHPYRPLTDCSNRIIDAAKDISGAAVGRDRRPSAAARPTAGKPLSGGNNADLHRSSSASTLILMM